MSTSPNTSASASRRRIEGSGAALEPLLDLAAGHPQRAMLLAHQLWEQTPVDGRKPTPSLAAAVSDRLRRAGRGAAGGLGFPGDERTGRLRGSGGGWRRSLRRADPDPVQPFQEQRPLRPRSTGPRAVTSARSTGDGSRSIRSWRAGPSNCNTMAARIFCDDRPTPTRTRSRLLGQPRAGVRRDGGGDGAAPGAGGRRDGGVLARSGRAGRCRPGATT